MQKETFAETIGLYYVNKRKKINKHKSARTGVRYIGGFLYFSPMTLTNRMNIKKI